MDCIEMFKQAAAQLQQDPIYVELEAIRQANDSDEVLQDLIGKFNLMRMDLNEEITKTERDEAKVTDLNQKVNALYNNIMSSEGMTRYNEAKAKAEKLVSYIDNIINTAMNGGDPMTVNPPEEHDCTGCCGNCGGCH